MILFNLVVIRGQTAIANQDCTSSLLTEHHLHLSLDPSNYIEICDVINVVLIHLLLLVDGLRISSSLKQREYLFLLQIALDVTFCTSLILGNVSEDRLNTAERSMMSSSHNLIDPIRISLDEVRSSVDNLCIREQELRIVKAIRLRTRCYSHSLSRNISMSQCSALSALIYSSLKRTHLLCIREDLLHVIVRQYILRGCSLKYIVLHFVTLLTGIVIVFVLTVFVICLVCVRLLTRQFVLSVFSYLSCDDCYYLLLLIGHRLVNFTDSLIASILVIVVVHVFSFVVGMSEFQIAIANESHFGLFIRQFTMRHNCIDDSTSVCSSENKRNFLDFSMDYISAVLLKLICPNRKSTDITMFN